MIKYIFKTIYPLAIIAVVIGGILGLLYQSLEPKLKALAIQETEDAYRLAFPEAVNYNEININSIRCIESLDSSNRILGFITINSNLGYGGFVTVLTSLTNSAIYQVVVLSMPKETPGLGTKARDPFWLKQFEGRTNGQIPQFKNQFQDYGLDAISGATLTSLAVSKSVNKALEDINTLNSLRNTNGNQTN